MFEKQKTYIVFKDLHYVTLAVSWIVSLLYVQFSFVLLKTKDLEYVPIDFLTTFATKQPINMS